MVRRCWKHSRQKTGRPCVGLNGTVVSRWHPEQIALVSTLCTLLLPWLKPSDWARLLLQVLQRFGSFLNCLSWKKSCSPAVKTKSAPQSTHFRTLSWNSIESAPFQITPARVGNTSAHPRFFAGMTPTTRVRPTRLRKTVSYCLKLLELLDSSYERTAKKFKPLSPGRAMARFY